MDLLEKVMAQSTTESLPFDAEYVSLMLNHFLNPICGKNNNHFD